MAIFLRYKLIASRQDSPKFARASVKYPHVTTTSPPYLRLVQLIFRLPPLQAFRSTVWVRPMSSSLARALAREPTHPAQRHGSATSQ